MSGENKAIVRRFVEEVQTKHRLELVDEIFDPNFIDHWPPGAPEPVVGSKAVADFKVFYSGVIRALPDVRVTIYDQIVEGDKVVTRKTLRGTHLGEFMGIPPTGKVVEIGIIDIFRIASGRLAEHWAQLDSLGLMQQLGVVPPPGQPPPKR